MANIRRIKSQNIICLKQNNMNEYDGSLTSRDFYSIKPKTGSTIILTIVFLIIAIVIFIILVRLFANRSTDNCLVPPNPPSTLSAQTVSNTQFDVFWSSSSNTNSYICYIGTDLNFTRAEAIQTIPTTNTNISVNGLDLGTTYYLFVTSVNSCGESNNSQQISFDFIL